MFESEIVGKIVTGLITALSAFVVCLLNNYFQNKREGAKRDAMIREQIEAFRDDIISQINQIKASHDQLESTFKFEFSMIKKDIESLSAKQDAYNNVIARTYALEQKQAVQEECIKVANNRIKDLESK